MELQQIFLLLESSNIIKKVSHVYQDIFRQKKKKKIWK